MKEQIKHLAKKYGFDACGVARADFLEESAPRLLRYLEQGKNGPLGYMANHYEKRLDPRLLVEGAKSVICFAQNYYTPSLQDVKDPQVPLIARFAYGKDYHMVIKGKLEALVKELEKSVGKFIYRIFTDSAPLLEREWARRAGLGWQGKNGNLIIPDKGSFFLLAEILCDLDLEPDEPFPEQGLCGGCRRCLMACPTGAIEEPRVVNASKCLSCLNIEMKGDIPDQYAPKMNRWLFGCDICLEVCPWNRRSTPHDEPEFIAEGDFLQYDFSQWDALQEERFDEMFRESSLKRAGYTKIKSTLRILSRQATDAFPPMEDQQPES